MTTLLKLTQKQLSYPCPGSIYNIPSKREGGGGGEVKHQIEETGIDSYCNMDVHKKMQIYSPHIRP